MEASMDTPHPLVSQLFFTRGEFLRALKGVSDADARQRLMPMNCIAWIAGHLAWQEQRYFVFGAGKELILPEIDQEFCYGAPPTTPSLKKVLAGWEAITQAADPYLLSLTGEQLVRKSPRLNRRVGDLLQRVIYHYWYHTGEVMSIRQLQGHRRLPIFVGPIDTRAPYRPETAPEGNLASREETAP